MMLPSIASVDLARIQFGLAASYHFLFVPLTLGLTWILFVMELVYLKTGKEVYKDMVRFWGKLFGINFALGVLTGLTLEFQFGTNWAYYSQYVGDIFGTPLAIEGLVAFMLESTFLGLFFFGWNRLSKRQHCFATFCLAIGSSLSALLILVANGYMQVPTGAFFDVDTVRMQTSSLLTVFMNPIAQIGFAHVVLGGYTTGAMFVLGISCFYLLKDRDVEFAKRSIIIAAAFGLISSIVVMLMGDQNGIQVYKYQPEKLAAIEGEWTTQTPPADFNVFIIPSRTEEKNLYALTIPDVLGVLVTHSFDTPVQGVHDIVKENEARIRRGQQAYLLLQKMRQGDTSPLTKTLFEQYKPDLGYGLLLTRYTDDLASVSDELIAKVAKSTIPDVGLLFYTFRIMVLFGVLMFFTFLFVFIFALRGTFQHKKLFQRWCLYSLPMPWIASLCGWFVTEHGRQPWTIYGVLPTDLSSSSVSALDISLSIAAFAAFYTLLFIVEIILMFKYSRLGPSALHTGRYHFETLSI